jgi:transglutaminase-like putative cysteine protease
VRYRLRHATRYSYAQEVDLASHMLHLSPRALPAQTVLSSHITTDPAAIRCTTGLDHFGNAVTWLFLDTPHASFEVVAESLVEVGFAAPPPCEATPAWEQVAAMAQAGGREGWEAAEFVFDSARAPADAEAGAYAAAFFLPGRPVLAGLLALNAAICHDFAFRAGVSGVATTVAQVMKQRAGVCQDFTHMMIAGLRWLGLPARYVSGYIRTRATPGAPRRQGSDQSHAWVSAWLGPDHGWVGLDPTNDLVVRDEHVVLAWGRDYSDISPVRGIILGGGRHKLKVGVDLEPI